VTRRVLFGAIAGGMGGVAWHEIGLSRKKHRSRKSPARVGAEAKSGIVHRPISDFVDAQGTTQVFVPPVNDVRAWTTPLDETPLSFAWIDYVGVADDFLDGDLHTGTSGMVTEQPNGDGRAKVNVVLHTHRALAWVIDLVLDDTVLEQIAGKTPFFGYRAQEVDDDHRPALVEVTFETAFLNTAMGAPLPDLVKAEALGEPPNGYEPLALTFRAHGLGATRDAETGDETGRARLTVEQVGVDLNRTDPTCNDTDCFPVETVDVRRIGRRP
jgi:hypothetical protein